MKITKVSKGWRFYHSPQDPMHNFYKWCVLTFGPPDYSNHGRWRQTGGEYFFRHAEDITVLKLRWEGIL